MTSSTRIEVVEAGEFVQHLARHQRGFGRADRLREQQQRDRLLNVSQMLADDLSILIGEQAHVVSVQYEGRRSEFEEIVERLSGIVVSRRRRLPLHGGAWREQRARVARVLWADPFGDRLHALESTAGSNEAHCAHE